MNHDEKKRLRKLLLKLRRANLDKPKRRATFMEVAGMERREVTISRLLAFFMESEAEHGLGDLWMQSLLSAATEADARFDPKALQTSPTSCSTEVVCANARRDLRIDIVAETPDVVLGIENKIGASLYNDLAAYAVQVRNMAGGRVPLLLTLTLRDEGSATSGWAARCEECGVSLCNVTYDALFARVKEGAGNAMLSADQEWLGHMRDFMITIENLGETRMQFDTELFAFMVENGPEIELLKRKMEEVARATKAQGVRLQAALADDPEIAAMGLEKPKVWSPDKYYLWCSTYINLVLPGKRAWAHPEISNNVDKTQVRCWVSGPAAKSMVRDAMVTAGLPIVEEHDEHLVYRNLPLEAGDEELISELKVLLKALLPIAKG
ncbi:MAG: PD-(D/E)XK nuclease family protein [Atopobiaceae bacterium]|nr:PD-(D/E)XK nuclease family protein [Atopobiaceae bacterium]